MLAAAAVVVTGSFGTCSGGEKLFGGHCNSRRCNKGLAKVQVGSVVLIAQRGQLRLRRERMDDRPNLMLPLGKPVTSGAVEGMNVEMMDVDEELRGTGYGGDGAFREFSEPVTSKARRRKRDADAANLPVECPRRSKRLRNRNEDPNFIYK